MSLRRSKSQNFGDPSSKKFWKHIRRVANIKIPLSQDLSLKTPLSNSLKKTIVPNGPERAVCLINSSDYPHLPD